MLSLVTRQGLRRPGTLLVNARSSSVVGSLNTSRCSFGTLDEKKGEDWKKLREKRWEERWEERFNKLKKLNKESESWIAPKEPTLANWVGTQRKLFKENKIRESRFEKLMSIDFPFIPTWNSGYLALEKHLKKNKEEDDPWPKKKDNGGLLYQWCQDQRKEYLEEKITADQKAKLDKIGFGEWSKKDEEEHVEEEVVKEEDDGAAEETPEDVEEEVVEEEEDVAAEETAEDGSED